MRRTVVLLAITAGLVGLFASGASARNTTHGAAQHTACSFGSCFSPSFPSQGATVKYKGPAAYWVSFADCCIAGDKYKVTAKGPSSNGTVTFTSSGALNSDCTTSTPAGVSYLGVATGSTVVTMKAISLPGGAPASAYVQMSASGWSQKKGTDGCGF